MNTMNPLTNCLINVLALVSPNVKEQQQNSLNIHHIRRKAETNHINNIIKTGKAKQVGDRLVVIHAANMVDTIERTAVNDTLSDFRIDDTCKLTAEDVIRMLQENTSK